MKNNEENKINYFSKIGKKLNIKYGNVFVEHYKNNKKLKDKYYRQELDNLLLDEKERNNKINKNTPPIILLKKRAELMLENEDNLNNSFFEDKNVKKPINPHKYYQLHLDKIKRLKTSNFVYDKPRDLVYEPNYNAVKKKIITGPKWNTMTGRAKKKKLSLNNSSIIIYPKKLLKIKIKNLKQKKEIKEIRKTQLTPLRKNYSSSNMFQNLKKIAKKLNLINLNLKNKENNNKSCRIFEKKNKIKKIKTPKKEEKIKNLFPQFYTPRTYLLNETDITNRYLKNVFLLNTSTSNTSINNKINNLKSIKTDTKIFKNKNIGLNHEQLKAINDFKKNKFIKEKIKKLKIKKVLNKKYNLLLVDNKNENEPCDKKIKFEGSKTGGIRLIKKSFNYYIDNPKNKDNNNKNINNNSFLLSYQKFKKNNIFYNFNINDLNEYSFQRFDKITLKTNNCN